MITGSIMIVAALIIFLGWYFTDTRKDKVKKAKEKETTPVQDVLMELILQLTLQEKDTQAIAVFCAYRALTMPDQRGLTAAMAAEVDRRYGSRMPWPKELRFQAKVLLDDFHADEISRIEADIQNLKRAREKKDTRDEVQAELATRMSGW